MLRLGDIDYRKKPVVPQLFLCKPNKLIISKLSDAYGVKYSQKLGALNELNFTLPVFSDKHHTYMRNHNASIIKGRYLVKMVLGHYTEFFVINNLSISAEEGETIDIQAMSLGYEMNDKILRSYEAVSKSATEILNEVLVDTIWRVGYVDSEFDMKRRGFNVSSNTVLESVFEVAKTFNALVVWDTIKRTVSFVRPELTGQDKGLKIKYGKYLESLNQEDNAEEIFTRLRMYGKEDISIREINPTGTTYIEDFSYFIYPYKEERKYFKQIYNSSDMKYFWLHNDVDWVESGNTLQCIANGSGKTSIINTGALNHKDYKMTATLRALSDDDVMGMIVRYQDSFNYYYIGWHSGKVQGGLQWGTEHLRIYKVEHGQETLLAKTSLLDGWSMNIDYKMAVETYNQSIRVWIDNRLVLNVDDETFSKGGFGFYSESQPFVVKDVEVTNKEHEVIKVSDYMSSELCHALLEYDMLLQENKDNFSKLIEKREGFSSVLNVMRTELASLKAQLKILLDERDVLNTRIAKMNDDIAHTDNQLQDTSMLEGDLQALITELNTKLIEIVAKESEVKGKEAQITTQEVYYQDILHEINLLKVLLDIRNNFTSELIDERNQYIIEKEWQDSNIEKPEDLLKEGIKVFNELKEQKVTVKVNIVNFLSMVTEQRNWEKLGMGDLVYIDHERANVLFKAKITEVEYEFEDEAPINITISNVKDLYANTDKFLDMLYKSYNSSTQVSIDSWKWDLSLENKGSINEIINNHYDANKQSILGAKDQVIEISDRGLIIRDPKDPNTYLVGLNGLIAITNDGGNTWKHAITGSGIVGERIYGKIFMGVNLALEDEDGVLKFQGSKGEIYDRTGKLVMKLGLVDENPDKFGLWSFNDVTRVKMDDREGFVIDRVSADKNKYPDGWEKIMWADPSDGTLYIHDLVAQNIKIVNDVGQTILDSENNYLDLGDFNSIVMDNKITTMEKMQLITELYKIEAGYKRMIEQAVEYQKSQRDDVFDINAQFFAKTSSSTDLFSTQPLTDAYYALLNYMSKFLDIRSQSPLDININAPITSQTQEINNRAEFVLKFKTYYDEEKNLRNKIEDAQFYSGLNMGQFYNNVVIGNYGFIALRNDGKYRSVLNATNGLALQKWERNKWVNKVYASIGNSSYEDGTLIAEDLVAKRLRIETKAGDTLLDADALNFDFSVLSSIILDDVIVSMEKITLLNQYKSISKQYSELNRQINNTATTIYNDRDKSYLGLDQAKNNLVNAGNQLTSSFDALTSYMQPVFVNMNVTTHIVRDLGSTRFIFHTKWEDFYKAYETARVRLGEFLERSSLQLGRNYNNTVIDAENGVVVTRGDKKVQTTLNATAGISIAQNVGDFHNPRWENKFYVDDKGFLFAVDMSTHRLRILDAGLGEKITFDHKDGITINGLKGEQIRLNANEGIAIDINQDKRLWIDTDSGTLRARKLIIEPEIGGVILDEETDGFVSDLMVNTVKTISKNKSNQDYVHIKNHFLKLMTGTSSAQDITKFTLQLNTVEQAYSFPEMIWGRGGNTDGDVGKIKKVDDAFIIHYKNDLHKEREIILNGTQTDAIKIRASGGQIVLDSDQEIVIKAGNSEIRLTPSGIKLKGARIDLN
ncbi:phage tail spike protein [Paenibacillus agilis]|uniref:Prophage tail endopeptidase domain-containing protein n=1 Tax=Paenibacillus agilis TaxID=3020863 RepID=A0A559IF33_9BACL|nr:phage tail spike protein [Paenibacillus agilis]TVX86083.1 hypothetical protein FPZ44_24415 [Paenibacillus agilis]